MDGIIEGFGIMRLGDCSQISKGWLRDNVGPVADSIDTLSEGLKQRVDKMYKI